MSGRWRGFSLLEVLISLVVIGIGLLGVVGLYTRGQQAEMESYQRAQALILVEDMVNRLNANRAAAGCYAITPTASETPAGTGHSGAFACAGVGTTASRAIADADLAAWDALLKGEAERLDGNSVGAMIGARGCVSANPAGDVYTIAVAWQGLAPTTAPAEFCGKDSYGDDKLRRVVTRTVRLADLD